MTETVPILEMRGITKRFPGTVANDKIDLDVLPGEVHALLGENGAGKSTLMNILYGLIGPDEGEIRQDGEVAVIRDPADAIRRGIGMVHQHFMLVPVLTVAENVILGQETIGLPGMINLDEATRRIKTLADQLGFQIDPRTRVDQPERRPAAAGGDPQGALPRGEGPRARRADRGPDAAGDQRDLRRPPPPQGRGDEHHLHHPQARRGPGNRGPDHGHPAWPGRGRAPAGRNERAGARRADGRPGGLPCRRPGRVAPRRAGPPRRGAPSQGRSRAGGRPRRRLRGSGRRDLRDRRRRRERPGRADRVARGAPQAQRRQGHARGQRRDGHVDAQPAQTRRHVRPRGPPAFRPRAELLASRTTSS